MEPEQWKELHDKRGHYVKRVREAVDEDPTKNGPELGSASLTQLDQTGMKCFKPEQCLRSREAEPGHRAATL